MLFVNLMDITGLLILKHDNWHWLNYRLTGVRRTFDSNKIDNTGGYRKEANGVDPLIKDFEDSPEDQNPYPGLRVQAFSATPDKLNLKLDMTKTIVFGAVMDWDMGDSG